MPVYDSGTTATTTNCSIIWVTATTSSATTLTFTDNSSYRYNTAPSPAYLQQRAVERHSDEAKRRARDLLLSHLSDEQRETFAKNRWFVVEGGRSKRQYRIRDNGGLVANIDALNEEGRVDHRLCGHADAALVPHSDHLLAQKLMLEAAEDDFLRIANRHAA